MDRKTILIVIALCGLAASGVGLLMNVSGLFFTPIAEELGLMKGTVSMTLTVGNICFSIGGLLMKLIPWKSAMGRPNCLRSLAYFTASSSADWAMPTAWAAMPSAVVSIRVT